MPNSYFKFKQFTIYQDKCAMKVCTDACLFAAWVAEKMKNEKCKTILDIGTGTGLLSLMLAQKTNAIIDAVEIDEHAALQARENFNASPWGQRLFISNDPIQQFNSNKKFDVIISNPPFFVQSLQSDDDLRNLAKHASSLSFEALNEIVNDLLAPTGKFYLLLPFQEFKKFVMIAAGKQLHLVEQADVQQTSAHSCFRSMGVFSKQNSSQLIHQTLTIKDHNDQYTSHFKQLLKDYYLHL